MITFIEDAGYKYGPCRACHKETAVRLHYWDEDTCEGWLCLVCLSHRPRYHELPAAEKCELLGRCWKAHRFIIDRVKAVEDRLERLIGSRFTTDEQLRLCMRLDGWAL